MIKMMFNGEDPIKHNFVAYNIHSGEGLVVMVDCEVKMFVYNSICIRKSNFSFKAACFIKRSLKETQLSAP